MKYKIQSPRGMLQDQDGPKYLGFLVGVIIFFSQWESLEKMSYSHSINFICSFVASLKLHLSSNKNQDNKSQ